MGFKTDIVKPTYFAHPFLLVVLENLGLFHVLSSFGQIKIIMILEKLKSLLLKIHPNSFNTIIQNNRNKMSKRRSSIFNNAGTTLSRKLKTEQTKETFGRSLTKKNNFPKSINMRYQKSDKIDYTYVDREKTYNRHIGELRDIINPRETTLLPFLISLRQHKNKQDENKKLQATVLQPFEVSDKTTANKKIKKDINDVRANPFRLSKVNYKWKNQTGASIRQATEFECSLRYDQQKKHIKDYCPYALVKPLRYRDTEKSKYTLDSLICERQKRIFTVEN